MAFSLVPTSTFPNGDVRVAEVVRDGATVGTVYLYGEVFYAAAPVRATSAHTWGHARPEDAARALVQRQALLATAS
jgi:hypothetical protein